jgi:uncharacterized protein
MVTPEVFLDTSFVIATSFPSDQFHAQALDCARAMRLASTRVLTTHAVLLEVGNSLSRTPHRPSAIQAINSLRNDPFVEVVLVTPDLFDRAFALFQQRLDKEWGLVDCVSFVVMQERGLTEALTSDQHFQQAGFVALLRR